MSAEATIKPELLEQLRAILTEVLELEPGQLAPTGSFVNDYEADSMTAIDIIARIEQELGVAIPDEALGEITDLNAVIGLVARYGPEETDAGAG